MESLAPLIVEPGRAKCAGQGVREHLRKRDLGWADRILSCALEVHDAQQLSGMDDRNRDLATNVGPRGTVVRVDQHVGNELDRPRGGRTADDAHSNLDGVERRMVTGDADHR